MDELTAMARATAMASMVSKVKTMLQSCRMRREGGGRGCEGGGRGGAVVVKAVAVVVKAVAVVVKAVAVVGPTAGGGSPSAQRW